MVTRRFSKKARPKLYEYKIDIFFSSASVDRTLRTFKSLIFKIAL